MTGDDLHYLLRALHNELTSRRRAAPRPTAANGQVNDDLDAADRGIDPEAAAENAELVAAIAELPDEFRDALVAVDIAGLSYREAARLLGLPEGTIAAACTAPGTGWRGPERG